VTATLLASLLWYNLTGLRVAQPRFYSTAHGVNNCGNRFNLNQIKNMKNLSLKMPAWIPVIKDIEPFLVAVILLLIWFTAPKLMAH
jgi:hypothetical protein